MPMPVDNASEMSGAVVDLDRPTMGNSAISAVVDDPRRNTQQQFAEMDLFDDPQKEVIGPAPTSNHVRKKVG